jgi:cystathionine beta-lyase/cystathionine gamma-synthase
LTSHSKISKEERENLGIFDGLLRFSVGIEDHNDIINDLKQAFSKI